MRGGDCNCACCDENVHIETKPVRSLFLTRACFWRVCWGLVARLAHTCNQGEAHLTPPRWPSNAMACRSILTVAVFVLVHGGWGGCWQFRRGSGLPARCRALRTAPEAYRTW